MEMSREVVGMAAVAAMRRRRRQAVAAVAVLLAAGLAGCGRGSEAARRLAASCAADVDVSDGFDALYADLPGYEAGKPPSAEYKAALKANFEQHMAGPVAVLAENAPSEVADEVRDTNAALRRFVETADASWFTPEVDAKYDRIDGYLYENCGGGRYEVTAADYTYADAPAQIPKGVTRLRLKNTGNEAHEMIVLARKPGVIESYDHILALPEEEGKAKVDVVTRVFAVEPGKNGYTTHEMEPGDYVMVCFIRQGSTSAEQFGEGPPHLALGMRRDLKVG